MDPRQRLFNHLNNLIFEKVHFGRKIWPFDPWRAWARVFLRITYTSFEMPYYCLTSCKKSKNPGLQFGSNLWKSPILGQIWPFDPAHRGSRVFFENRKTSLFYKYAALTLCKISKTSGARILRYQRYGRTDEQTDERTDKAEFIGPFQLKPWVQKWNEGFNKVFSISLSCFLHDQQLQNFKWVCVMAQKPETNFHYCFYFPRITLNILMEISTKKNTLAILQHILFWITKLT